jgi:hypothetical protein
MSIVSNERPLRPAGDLTFAVATPSFRGDFEQCRLLVETGERFLPQHVKHYLVVDRRDYTLFKPLQSTRVEVLCVEDVLPWWLMRIPMARKWWMSLKSPPIRNWMLQQIIKLRLPAVVPSDVLLFTDSDCFFIRPFDPRDLVKDGKVPLFREHSEKVKNDVNTRWKGVAAKLLGIPGPVDPLVSYVGNFIPWRRENAIALQKHIEKTTGQNLITALSRLREMSEYVVHGMFVENVLGLEKAGLYSDSVVSSLAHWRNEPLDEPKLRAFKEELLPRHFTVMISAKSRTPISAIRRVFIEGS